MSVKGYQDHEAQESVEASIYFSGDRLGLKHPLQTKDLKELSSENHAKQMPSARLLLHYPRVAQNTYNSLYSSIHRSEGDRK